MGSYQNVEPAYAAHKVAQIDAEIAASKDRTKVLTEQRKQLAAFLPKKSD